MAIQKKSEGFGDSVAKFTHTVGLDKLAEKVAKAMGKSDCGCSGRQQALNDPNLLINKVFYKSEKSEESQTPQYKQINTNENN